MAAVKEDEPDFAVPEGQVPKYKVLQPTFFEPIMVKTGSIVEYDGEPGPHLEPLNQAAREMLYKYYKAKPGASLQPTEALAMTVDGKPLPPVTPGAAVRPTVNITGEAPEEEILSFQDMADRTKTLKVTGLAEAMNKIG
jgi:hypothetical protein